MTDATDHAGGETPPANTDGTTTNTDDRLEVLRDAADVDLEAVTDAAAPADYPFHTEVVNADAINTDIEGGVVDPDLLEALDGTPICGLLITFGKALAVREFVAPEDHDAYLKFRDPSGERDPIAFDNPARMAIGAGVAAQEAHTEDRLFGGHYFVRVPAEVWVAERDAYTDGEYDDLDFERLLLRAGAADPSFETSDIEMEATTDADSGTDAGAAD